MEDLDIKILRVMQRDCRKSFRDIAKEVGSTPATIISHVEKMEKEGIIRGYHADLNYNQLGFGLPVIIEINVNDEKGLQNVAKAATDSHTLGVYEVSGDSDALILAKFENQEELRKYIRKYLLGKEHIGKIATRFVMNIRGEKPTIDL